MGPGGAPGQTRQLQSGTAALTGPAPPACGERRPRSCRGQSAAKSQPQLRPRAGALAPPIVKGPAGGSAYKASAGAHAPRHCQSRLAIQPGHPRAGQSAARPGPGAAPGRGLRAPAGPGGSPKGPGAALRFWVPESPDTTYCEEGPRCGQRSEESAGEIIMLIIIPLANSLMLLTCREPSTAPRCPTRKVPIPQFGV